MLGSTVTVSGSIITDMACCIILTLRSVHWLKVTAQNVGRKLFPYGLSAQSVPYLSPVKRQGFQTGRQLVFSV